MLIKAENANVQTKESIENYIDKKIWEAANNREYHLILDTEHTPMWVVKKLIDLGYTVSIDAEMALTTIGWELLENAE